MLRTFICVSVFAALRLSSSFNRRKTIIPRFLAGEIRSVQKEDTMAQTTATQRGREQPDKDAIRPFQANFPETELTELRRRINATKWPERETVADATQGVQLATMQNLA